MTIALEILFWLMLTVWGYVVIRRFMRWEHALALSLPMGMGCAAFSAILLYLIPFQWNLLSGLVLMFLVLAAGLLRYQSSLSLSWNKEFPVNIRKELGVGIGVLLPPVLFFSSFNVLTYASDSLTFFDGLGHFFALSRMPDTDSAFLPVAFLKEPLSGAVHALAYEWGIDHFQTLTPVCSVWILVSVCAFVLVELKNDNYKANFLFCLLVVFFMCSPFYIEMSLFLLPNLVTALFLTSGMYLLLQVFVLQSVDSLKTPSARNKQVLLILLSLMFGFSSLSQPDMRAFVLIPLFLIARDYYSAWIFTLVYIPIAYLWPLGRLLYVETPFVTAEIYGAAWVPLSMFALHITITILAPHLWKKLKQTLMLALGPIVFCLMLLGLALALPIDFSETLHNLTILLFKKGRWGNFWYVIIPLALLAVVMDTGRRKYFFITLVAGFFSMRIIVYSIAPMPDGSWGYAANRVLLHIAPFMVFYIIAVLGKSLDATLWRKPEKNHLNLSTEKASK
jgi:hypothetical protein